MQYSLPLQSHHDIPSDKIRVSPPSVVFKIRDYLRELKNED